MYKASPFKGLFYLAGKTSFMSRKKNWLLALIPLAIGTAYLLWPLSSRKLDIHFDEEKIRFREAFLAEKTQQSDTLQRPNFILIMADDLGKTDISLYGSPYVNTPNIDAIGKNGVVFQEGYVSSPICSPSRAGLLTGRYQQRFGYEIQPHDRYPKNRLELYFFKHFMDTGDWLVTDQKRVPRRRARKKQGLPPTEFTLAELLKKVGYQTAIIGKWHLGDNKNTIPINRGFDYHYGFYEAFTLYDDPKAPDIINQRHQDFSDPHIWGKGRKGSAAIRRNHKKIKETTFLTDKMTEEALQFLEANQNSSFFLYLPFLTPHTPFQITEDYYNQFAHIEDRNKRVYYAMIKSLDDAVGKITKRLQELGLSENTLIVFLSDNGGATYTKATDNAPLKGGKFNNFEGGINVPFIMQWEGKIPAGLTFNYPVISMDIFRTFTCLAKVGLPSDRIFDGVNLIPYILQENKESPHQALYWRSFYHKAIRKGDWKLVWDEKSGEQFLANLSEDKVEQNNLVETQLEKVRKLKEEYQQWEKKLMAPRWPQVMDYRWNFEGALFYFPL